MPFKSRNHQLRVISHRCLGFGFAENSAAALCAALSSSVDEVELDFRVTSDGELVASHLDFFLDERRMPRLVSRQSLARNQQHGLMSLAECLNIFCDHKSRKKLRLEIKSPGVEQAVVRMLREFGLVDKVVVVSWRVSSLRRFRALAPDLELALSFMMGLQGDGVVPVSWPNSIPHALSDRSLQIRSVNVVRGLVRPSRAYIARLIALDVEVFTLSKGGSGDMYRLQELGVTGALFSSFEGLFQTAEIDAKASQKYISQNDTTQSDSAE